VTSWLAPTPFDRARVLETNERIRRPRTVGLMLLVLASAAASPWLGWTPVAATGAAILVGAVADRHVPRSRRPELVALGMIALTAGLLGVAAAESGGAQSPVLILNAVVVTAAAAYFRGRGVAVSLGLAVASILSASLTPHPGRLLAHPALPILTIALVATLVVFQRVSLLAELDHRRRSVVDPLTGALNRHALTTRFDELRAQAAAGGAPVSAIACDLDRFKRVNDLYGHERGDLVLKDAVRAMRSALRGFDSLYRLGGEEFLIVLPRTTIEQGNEVAERVRAAVELARPGGLGVTISLGVAAGTGPEIDHRKVLARADQALYVAKRRGRNRVVSSTSGYAAAS
jgi:diguanylate cyclase (GGDEF)-like protein